MKILSQSHSGQPVSFRANFVNEVPRRVLGKEITARIGQKVEELPAGELIMSRVKTHIPIKIDNREHINHTWYTKLKEAIDLKLGRVRVTNFKMEFIPHNQEAYSSAYFAEQQSSGHLRENMEHSIKKGISSIKKETLKDRHTNLLVATASAGDKKSKNKMGAILNTILD